MRVCVLGLGRVGLPTAALLARSGHEVVGAERDPVIRARIASGEAGDAEPGLRELLAVAPITMSERPVSADAYLVCVATPVVDGVADLADLRAARSS